jgi:uncharacterized membrane protein
MSLCMLSLLAHAEGGSGSANNPILTPWEIHPILIHFPIAFLLGAVLLSAYARSRGRLDLERISTGLLIAGVVTGLLAAAAGFLAFFTVPGTHTEVAHRLMYWHLGLMAASLLLFLAVGWLRWRSWDGLATAGTQLVGWLAAVIFVIGAAVGGQIVYHGATGIEEDLVRPGLHEEHHHGHGTEEYPGQEEEHSGHQPSHDSH